MGRALAAWTAALAAALSLGACAAGPDYKAPASPPTTAYGPVPASPSAPASPLAGDWWRALGSPEIDARVAEALAANPDVAVARARLAQAREAAIRAGAAAYPTLDATAQVTRLTTSFLPQGIDQRGALTNDYLIGPSVAYAVDVFGGARRLREQRAAQQAAAAFELEAARLAVAGAVVRTAVEAARLRTQLDASEAVLAGGRDTVDAVQRLLAVRRRTVADLAAAQSRLAEDEAAAQPLRRQLIAAEAVLAVLTGRTPGESPPSALRLSALSLPPPPPASLPAELVRRRPDVRASEAQLRAANAAIGVAAARRLPSLNLTGSITQEALSVSRLFDSAATGGFLTASVRAPLFDGGALRSQQREAEAAYDEAAAVYRRTVLASVGQVSEVLRDLDADVRAEASEAAAVDAAQRAAASADTLYAAARIDILRVLSARQDLGEAQQRLAAARAQRLLDTVQLHVALGGGTDEAPPR